jgi:hypothetical protein
MSLSAKTGRVKPKGEAQNRCRRAAESPFIHGQGFIQAATFILQPNSTGQRRIYDWRFTIYAPWAR